MEFVPPKVQGSHISHISRFSPPFSIANPACFAPFVPSRGDSMELPFHEQLTLPAALSKSCPVKPGQTRSNHFVALTNLDHEHPPHHVQSRIETGSPDTCMVQGARIFPETRGFLPFCILHSAFCISFTTPSLHHSFRIYHFAFCLLPLTSRAHEAESLCRCRCGH